MTSKATSIWLPRVLFESLLIVVSILVALALDKWRDDRQNDENTDHALSSFIGEINRNKELVLDNIPFNQGLRHVINRRQEVRATESVATFVNIIESYDPVFLHSTAWETAIATGALANMDYNLVSALSLTYSLQDRYQQFSRAGLAELTSPQNLSEEKLEFSVYSTIRYLDDVIRMETELGGVYTEAESLIRSAKQTLNGEGATEPESLAKDLAHP